VRDAERLRISRDLHDGWGHELTALGLPERTVMSSRHRVSRGTCSTRCGT
jgi:signal transduction histidine kinase